jgi:hypothetical protein
MPRRGLGRVIYVFAIGVLTVVSSLGISKGFGAFLPKVQAANTGNIQQGDLTLYLPIIMRGFPPIPTSFGVEILPNRLDNPSELNLVSQAGVYWARIFVIDWSQIEPIKSDPPVYHWEMVDESDLQNANSRGLRVIATVKFTPSWAQKIPGAICGPILQNELARFAQFMQTVVQRYSSYPYNVKFWEMGNEPDIDPALVPPDIGYGCWGDANDDYYGGGYYAEMLKAVYPVIKAEDPRAQVLLGGLLLDCDPEHPPAGKDCKSAKFLEGILRHNGANDGSDYFDIVSFHGYPPFMNTLYQGNYVSPLGWDEQNPGWVNQMGADGVGGVVMGKIHFIQNVLSSYSVSKPLMHTEGSLMCPEWNTSQCNPPTNIFYETQADYVVWLYVRNLAAGVESTIWYSFEDPGWRFCGLLDEQGQPKPAYNAFKFLTQELKSANYVGAVTQYPELRGYEFSVPGKWIWVLWAPDEQPHPITLPLGTKLVYDKYGNNITPTGSDITVNHPIYVEINPEKPQVSWVSPVGDGQYYYLVGDTAVHLEANATGNIAIARVRFYRWDKVNLQYMEIGSDYTYPYIWELDPKILYLGWNEIDVEAYDKAGNISNYKYIFLFR